MKVEVKYIKSITKLAFIGGALHILTPEKGVSE